MLFILNGFKARRTDRVTRFQSFVGFRIIDWPLGGADPQWTQEEPKSTDLMSVFMQINTNWMNYKPVLMY